MKIWYEACCDIHKEICPIMVDSPLGTIPFVEDTNNAIIQEWLMNHRHCKLRIISEDEEFDFVFENNYHRHTRLSS